MKKAVISNRIYISCTPDLEEKIEDEVRHEIPSYMVGNPPEIINNMARIRQGLVSIPSGRVDLIPSDYEVVDKRILNPVEFPEFKATLRQGQQEVYDAVDDNYIVNAKPSWGKTFTAIAIAKKLGQKTLVVVHTSVLAKQWRKEIKKTLGIEAGQAGGGVFDLDAPIVVGITRTLYNRIDDIKKEFGTLILDEMHHVSSPTFGKIVDASFARYKIGLSGTVKRKDLKHVMFPDYFGNKILVPKPENSMTPVVHILRTGVRFIDSTRTPWALRVNDLVRNEEYQHTIPLTASSYAARGHKVLVVSDRVQFLEDCKELTGDNAICVTGDTDEEEREVLFSRMFESGTNILYGTQSIFCEGVSIDCLSCLVLATPVNNDPLLEQLIGRIQREYPGRKRL